ncbi:hypothetical protein LX87_05026 [Larkinella arboricola]|uniref:Uncharacterized protein n=1 Tax=Larkinella arboricola TaxID=643671 RepID=A0A327WLR1_LARAB|nr:hypothetical protein [Larkinella arboricola]RAJ92695.1 hypothetical protein LX87_05026 [Larkinella arboricola]
MRPLYYQLIIAGLLLTLLIVSIYSYERLSDQKEKTRLLESKLTGLQTSYLQLYAEKEHRLRQQYAFVAVETIEKDIIFTEKPMQKRFYLSPVLTIEGEDGQYQAKDNFMNQVAKKVGSDVRVLQSKIYVFDSYREASEYREQIYQAEKIDL